VRSATRVAVVMESMLERQGSNGWVWNRVSLFPHSLCIRRIIFLPASLLSPPSPEFRHYDLSVKAVGISKSVKSIIGTKVPDLSQYEDISEFITK